MRAGLFLLLVATSCDRGHHDAPVPSTPAPHVPAVAVPAPGACTLAPISSRMAAPARVVAIGDLHGDLGGTRAALRAAGVIDAQDGWSGGATLVVQTGDVLDRGNDESKILELLDRLDREASRTGGGVLQLLGNHELMNAAEDYRYVTQAALADFDGDRKKALDPGGPWAKRFARHNVVEIVGDTVYSHAGVLGDWAAKLDQINLETRCWLDGQAGGPGDPPAVLTSDESPVWTRTYGIPGLVDCAALDHVLGDLGARRMVVGHTVQDGGITSACDGKLWRIDVGLAKLYGGPIQVLEVGTTAQVLRGDR